MDLLDELMRVRASGAYRLAVQEWERRIEAEQERFAAKLRDPEENRRLGLPEHLPEETIAILKRTQALDKIGPERPRRKFNP